MCSQTIFPCLSCCFFPSDLDYNISYTDPCYMYFVQKSGRWKIPSKIGNIALTFISCVITIYTNINYSSRSYSCVQFSIALMWKQYLTILAKRCHSTPGLFIAVSNTSDRSLRTVRWYTYGYNATAVHTIEFFTESMLKVLIIKTTKMNYREKHRTFPESNRFNAAASL
jgi:hypothetical protein